MTKKKAKPPPARALGVTLVPHRLQVLLRLLEKMTGREWPGLDLRQLALAEWLATPQWDKPQSEKSLVGWCLANHVPDRTARRWKQDGRVTELLAAIVDLTLGAGSYDTQVWMNLVRRTAIDTEAIRVYFQLRGKLATPGPGGVTVNTGPVDARTQGLIINVDDADSYRKALGLFGDNGKEGPQ